MRIVVNFIVIYALTHMVTCCAQALLTHVYLVDIKIKIFDSRNGESVRGELTGKD